MVALQVDGLVALGDDLIFPNSFNGSLLVEIKENLLLIIPLATDDNHKDH